MRKLLLPALLATCLAACASTSSKLSGAACPSLPVYSEAVQDKAADELDAMPEGSVIAGIFMPDYARMRAGVRECIKAQNAGAN